jgi:hypothetical protein
VVVGISVGEEWQPMGLMGSERRGSDDVYLLFIYLLIVYLTTLSANQTIYRALPG